MTAALLGGPPALLAKLPVLAAAVFDVLPLEARLDRVALINSATGELWPVPAHPASVVDEIGMRVIGQISGVA